MIYQRPANTFIASFIGSPPMNLLEGHIKDGSLWIAGNRIDPPAQWKKLLAEHQQLRIGIRREQCYLSDIPLLSGHVEFMEYLGSQRCIHLRLHADGQRMLYLLPADQPIPSGTIGLSFSWQHVNAFDWHTGSNIGHPKILFQSYAC